MDNTQEKMTLDQLPVGGSCILCQVGNQRGAVKRRLNKWTGRDGHK